ncbi:MAG: adenosylmethionine--8-amino-7-oxononanoate transaminase [Pseudomonadota bacterium]
MNIIEKSLKHIWYPAAQMEDYQIFKPQHIKKAYGSYIEMSDGRRVIDAISSWWCKSLGHCHPRLQQALIEQMSKFEHVMQPHMTHETIANLSEKLSGLTNTLSKSFYASDGSTAVEIALKMSLHAQQNQGHLKRSKFIALTNGYHGETIACLSVSDLGKYNKPYKDLLFKANFIPNIPYVLNQEDLLWEDCNDIWQKTKSFLDQHKDELAAIIIEPIVQGAGGMKIYSQDFLKQLRSWTLKNGVYLIADEIMTGLGRTGKMLACEHSNIEADFLCLSKGLTSGMLPLSVCLTSQKIYDIFYEKDPFLHSNTHYGNALAASVALEVLKIFEEEDIVNKAASLNMASMMEEIAKSTGLLTNIRSIGAIIAGDLIDIDSFKLYKQAMKNGAILRPMGNCLYWLPPLNISQDTLNELAEITQRSLLASR